MATFNIAFQPLTQYLNPLAGDNLFLRMGSLRNAAIKGAVLISLILLSLSVSSQIKFSATLNPSVISRNEVTTIRFVLENAGDIQGITPPSFKNFILISGPVQETGMTNINGRVTNYLAISFVFKTAKPGKFRIPGAVATVSGKAYKSNTVQLTVKNKVSPNPNSSLVQTPYRGFYPEARPANTFKDYIFKTGEDVASKVEKNMQLRLEVNKKTCYVGEPIIAAYKLYTRLKSESKLTKNPSFSGFSVIDLQAPDVTESGIEKLNGRDYNVYTIRKAQLYPLQDGSIELEVAEVENNIQFIREGYANSNAGQFADIFEEFANASAPPEAVIEQTVFLKNKAISIVVKPLPEEGRPAGFKGAVGNFQIESGLENYQFPAGKAGKLIVMLSGSGNLQLVNPLQINWPPGYESFDVKASDILSLTSVPVSGKKIFEYPFTIDHPGNYIFPSISFDYFDPEKKSYKTVQTNPISFSVTGEIVGKALKSMPDSTNYEKVAFKKIFYERGWLVAIIAFLFIGGLFLYLRNEKTSQTKKNALDRDRKDMVGIIESSAINQTNPLTESEKCLGDDDCGQFYSVLLTEIKQFLIQKLDVKPEDFNSKRIAEKMDAKGISNDTVLSLQQLLHELEWQLYTPFERNEKMIDIYTRSHELLQLINTYDARSTNL